jgi:hypothetical protein
VASDDSVISRHRYGFSIGTLDIALLFSAALLTIISLHVAAVSIRWVGTNRIEGRLGIPYAPSIAGALG